MSRTFPHCVYVKQWGRESFWSCFKTKREAQAEKKRLLKNKRGWSAKNIIIKKDDW